jgi:hypothetical protein
VIGRRAEWAGAVSGHYPAPVGEQRDRPDRILMAFEGAQQLAGVVDSTIKLWDLAKLPATFSSTRSAFSAAMRCVPCTRLSSISTNMLVSSPAASFTMCGMMSLLFKTRRIVILSLKSSCLNRKGRLRSQQFRLMRVVISLSALHDTPPNPNALSYAKTSGKTAKPIKTGARK